MCDDRDEIMQEYDSTWGWTQVSRIISEHSAQ